MAYLGHKPATGENNSFRILDDISSFVLTFDGSSASVVGLSDETITITENNHRFITGQRVTYNKGSGNAIGGLTHNQAYFVINHSPTQIKLASSASNALAGTAINLTALGTGSSHTLTLAFDGVNTKFVPTFGNGMHDTLIKRAAQLVISINGVIQQPHDTATPSTGFGVDSLGNIIFSTAPASTDVFWAHILATNTVTFDSTDNDVDTFTGNGSTTSFTLSKTPPDNRNILVTIDGVVQYPSDAANTRSYSVSENVMTFVAAPGNGTVIQVRHIGFAGPAAGGGGGVTGFYGRTGNVSLVSTDNITVNDAAITGNATVTGNLVVDGDMTTLNTTLREVELLRVDANSSAIAGIITQRGSGDIFSAYDTSTQVFKIADGGDVTFFGGSNSKNASWDYSANTLTFDGNGSVNNQYAQAQFGSSSQGMKLYNNLNNFIDVNPNVALFAKTADFQIFGSGSRGGTTYDGTIFIAREGVVELGHEVGNGGATGIKLKTVGYGVTVFGTTETQKLNVTGISTFQGQVRHTSGNFLLGTTTETNNIRLGNKFAIVGTAAYTGMSISQYAGTNAAHKPMIDFNRSRGSADGTMTSVAVNDGLGEIIFRGSDGSNFEDAAAIRAWVDATPSNDTTDMPGRLTFHTSADGDTDLHERLRITNDGKLLVGATAATNGSITEFSKSVGGGGAGCHITVENTSTNSVNNTAGYHCKTNGGVAKFFAYSAPETYVQSRAGGTADLFLQANGASNLRLYTNSDERLRIKSDGTTHFYGNQTTAPEGDFGFRWDRNSQVNFQLTNTNNTSVNAGGRITLKTNHGTLAGSYYNNGGFYLINSGSGYLNYYTDSVLRLNIDVNGHVTINPGTAVALSSSNGQVGKKFGIKSTQNNIVVGETTNSGNSGLILESRVTGRSGNARCSQIDLGNGIMKFYTAASGADVTERFRITAAGTAVFGGDTSTPIVDNGELFYRGNSTKTFQNLPQNFYLYSDDIAYNGTNPGAGMLFGGAYNSSAAYTTFSGIHGVKQNNTDGDTDGIIVFGTRQHGSGSWERARLTSEGTFSIGNTNPDTANYRLDCAGSARFGTGSYGSKIVFSRSGLGDELVIGVDGYGNSNANEATIQSSINFGRPLVFATSNTERLRIESGGDLQLNNADSVIHTSADTSRLRLFGGSTNSVNNGAALALNGVSHSAGNYADLAAGVGGFIKFRVGTSEKLRIQSNGNVGIARTTNNAQTSSTDSLYDLSINRESSANTYDGLNKSLNVDNQYTVQTFRATNSNRSSISQWYDVAHFRAWDINARVIIQAGGTFTGDQINIDVQSSYNSALANGRSGPVLEVKRTEAHNGGRFTKVRIGCHNSNRQPILQVYFNGGATHGATGSVTVTVHDYGSNYGHGAHRGEAKWASPTTLNETWEELDIDGGSCDYFNTSTTPAFSVFKADNSNQIGSGTYAFNSQILDRGGDNYNTSNGRFTAPCDGVYYFIATLQMYGGSSTVHARFQKNGTDVYNNGTNTPYYDEKHSTHANLQPFCLVELSTDDYVECVRNGSTRGMQSAMIGFLVR